MPAAIGFPAKLSEILGHDYSFPASIQPYRVEVTMGVTSVGANAFSGCK